MSRLVAISLVICHSMLFATTEQTLKPLIDKIAATNQMTPEAKKNLEATIAKAPTLTQGNPKVSQHPISSESCNKDPVKQDPEFLKVCQAPFMAPIYQDQGKAGRKAVACIDQFEFPNLPCEYPLVWVSPKEAAQICEAMDKRLCDASEWEAGCAGEDLVDRYVFEDGKIDAIHKKQRQKFNKGRKEVWGYGSKASATVCATGSGKSPKCDQALTSGKGVYQECGSNTYPTGAFKDCKSKTGVYDLHGNAAEHMNLATNADELTRNGGTGYTEMKGSWFVFNKIKAHPDDCYWRAPFWHGSKVNIEKGHRNYHLSFRCCKTLK